MRLPINFASRFLLIASIIFIISSVSFANSFGPSRITITRSWDIVSEGSFDFTGAIGVNNSNQKIVSIQTQPQMEITSDSNETVWLHYHGNRSIILNATVIFDVDYDTNLSSDPPVPGKQLPSTNLTEPDEGIILQAKSLSDERSSLVTIRNLVNWVHDNLVYDISYWGMEKSAREAFKEKRGVCVEYTHLLIALSRSLGFDTRYVSGYVMANSWQPHAWAEIMVPGYGYLPADPTFGEAGILDNTHIALQKVSDQSKAFDELLSSDPNATASAEDRIEPGFFSEDDKGAALNLSIDRQTLLAESTITNTRSEYLLGAFRFEVPKGFGNGQESVVLLHPHEAQKLYNGLNVSLFEKGFTYNVPVSASFNDAKAQKNVTVDFFTSAQDQGKNSLGPTCLPVQFIALFFGLLAVSAAKS